MGWTDAGKAHNFPNTDLAGDESIVETATKLAIFADCAGPKASWHEPDEEEITAVVKGKILDNAHGDDGLHGSRFAKVDCPDGKSYSRTEKVVVLRCGANGDEVQLSLASVLALATYGARKLVSKKERQAILDNQKHGWVSEYVGEEDDEPRAIRARKVK